VWVQAALDSADFTPAFFVNDRSTGSAAGSHFSLVENKVASHQLVLESPSKIDDDAKPESYHQIPSPLKRSSTARASFLQEEGRSNIESISWYLRFPSDPELGLPIDQSPTAALSLIQKKRQFTSSMVTQSTTGSAGVITYASHSPLATATARTIDVQALSTDYLSDKDKS
jgi:hypothetical protein